MICTVCGCSFDRRPHVARQATCGASSCRAVHRRRVDGRSWADRVRVQPGLLAVTQRCGNCGAKGHNRRSCGVIAMVRSARLVAQACDRR